MTDSTFYKNIWLKREHKCQECGHFLGNERQAVFFSHVIPKEKYPKLRHYEDNIDLLCFDHHYQYEFGDKKSMKIYDEGRMERLKLLDRSLGKGIKMRA